MPPMTPDEMAAFLQLPLVATFSTCGPDGAPRVSPVWFQFEAGRFYVWSDLSTVKVHNVQRDPRIALCIATHEEPYRYVIARGRCVLHGGDIYDRALAITTRYWGPERGAEYARLARQGDSVILEIAPDVLQTERSA